MAEPKGGYFVYNDNVYERQYRPLDDAWTIYDENGAGVDYATNKAVYDAAAATADDAVYEDLTTAKLNISPASASTVDAPGQLTIPHIEPIAALDPSTPEGAALQAKIQALPSEKRYQGLFGGNMQPYQTRKNWVAEHQDYLKAKNANIDWSNYRGTAELNLALKSLLGGYDAWQAAQTNARPGAKITPGGVTPGAREAVDPDPGPFPSTLLGSGPTPDPYKRSKTGVYQDAEGNIDWVRSVKPEAYREARLNDVQSAYNADMDLLKSTFNGHMNIDQTNAYWAKWRELHRNKRLGRKQALAAGKDYQKAYTDYIYGQIGKAPDAGVEGEARQIPESDKTVNSYFTYTPGNFKQGGSVNYQKIFN